MGEYVSMYIACLRDSPHLSFHSVHDGVEVGPGQLLTIQVQQHVSCTPDKHTYVHIHCKSIGDMCAVMVSMV